MAQYKTHAKFNLLLALPILTAAVYFWFTDDPLMMAIFCGSFAYGTLFMNPDLDLAHQIKFFSLRGILTSPFRLYSMIFSHRGLSHSIVFGTLSRILFIALLATLGIWVYTLSTPSFSNILEFVTAYQTPLSYAFAGLFLADLSHLLLDI